VRVDDEKNWPGNKILFWTHTKALTSNLPFESGSMTPFSVMIPLMLHAGVTSKAGFQHGMFDGALDVEINSSEERSSIGILIPDSSVISNDVIGAAT
jgi:hypothetical protein